MRDLGQRVAGDREPQPEVRVADAARRALVDEGVVDAAAGALLLRALEQAYGARSTPQSACAALLGDRGARLRGRAPVPPRPPAPTFPAAAA